jgi:tetratricopeptide (TPR) repeat protein
MTRIFSGSLVVLTAVLAATVGTGPALAQSTPVQASPPDSLDILVRTASIAETAGEADQARELLRQAVWFGVQAVEAAELQVGGAAPAGEAPGEEDRLRTGLRALLDRVVFETDWGPAELERLRRAYRGSALFERYAAELAARGGEPLAALRGYDRLLRLDPQDAGLIHARGRVLEELDRTDEAVHAYMRALDLAPEDEATFRDLLRLRQEAGALAELLEQVQRLRLINPESAVLAERETEVRHRLGSGADPDTAGTGATGGSVDPGPLSGAIPVRFSGHAQMGTELYHSRGVDPRRPGAAWRLNMTPQAALFGGVAMGVDVLLSDQGSEARFQQNINQFGISPSWAWGTLHLGDFSHDHSRYTVEGMRVRGAGVELHPGIVRLSVQGGRQLRMAPLGTEGAMYRRNMIAASAGLGRVEGAFVNLHVVSARDDLSTEETLVLLGDTILADTIPVDLRPRMDNRPQENLAVAAEGGVVVLNGLVSLRGEGAASLITRDLLASEVGPGADGDPTGSVIGRTLGEIHPLRLSSAVDYAWTAEGTLALATGRVRAGYEYVGPGYTSLGLAYLINDRRAYRLDGAFHAMDGRLGLQAQYRSQTHNLADQRLHTVDRHTVGGTATFRATPAVLTSVGGLVTTAANDAPADSARLDTRAFALTATTAVQGQLMGRASVLSLGYTLQRTTDGNIAAVVPDVSTHNVTTSLQVSVRPHINVAPSVSGVVTGGTGLDTQRNLLLGFRGTGRFLEGDLRTSASLTHSVSHGRQVSGFQTRASHPLGWGTEVSLQTRHTRYSAFGDRPAFDESFITVSVARSF